MRRRGSGSSSPRSWRRSTLSEALLRELYDSYLATGRTCYLGDAYEHLRPVAAAMVRKTLHRRGFSSPLDKIEEMAHIAASGVVEMMQQRKRIVYFGKKLRFSVDDLFDPRYVRNRVDSVEMSILEDHVDARAIAPEVRTSSIEPMLRIMDHRAGRRVILDMVASGYFKIFIQRIESYMGRRWIYDHAEDLQWLYKRLRKLRNLAEDRPRPGSAIR